MKPPLKHRWSISHNYLTGITAGDWWRLLEENNFAVDPVYWHRAAVVSVLSVANSFYRLREDREYGDQVAATVIGKAPLFILGHWRSGTTHLHNLLAQDDTSFAYANTYQVVNPHIFLTTEEVRTRRFAKLLPDKRPMDNMALNFQSPQEDEFAPLLITLKSSYLGVSFPRREDHYNRYLSFDGVPGTEIEEWKRGLEWFLKKLTFKYGPERRLLLKSPTHTARVKLLLEMFPDAKFVHIHRRPEEVLQSFRHYYDTAMWHTYLQRPDRSRIDDEIFQRYRSLMETLVRDRPSIPEGNFHEVSFADLERDPIGTVAGIYQALSLDGAEQALPKIRNYTDTLTDYEKNRFKPLEEASKQRIREEWAHIYEPLGYRVE
ncbi:sulfotransferase [Haloferula sp. BvORR071]|uniref:sulfotransferase family protein n=1 Tax=Haloferula sp. BvORR071 TaxID=1396141 RepID=UPI0006964B3F|nr:sulfotransferase [Haloferula sp. BvORR071]